MHTSNADKESTLLYRRHVLLSKCTKVLIESLESHKKYVRKDKMTVTLINSSGAFSPMIILLCLCLEEKEKGAKITWLFMHSFRLIFRSNH